MEKSETQGNINVELTKAELDAISIGIVLVNDVLFDPANLPTTVMMIKLGYKVKVFDSNTLQGLTTKFKKFLKE